MRILNIEMRYQLTHGLGRSALTHHFIFRLAWGALHAGLSG
jgi:hypothetical protein